ncbi:MAG: hypothetical protein FJX18_07230 [Alphaproteobacteria bacterium]|nr:hypothetical protein [Alphaproteobacteria bacterium]
MQKLYVIVGIFFLSFLGHKNCKAATLPEEGGGLRGSFRKLSPSELQWIYSDAHCHPIYPKYTEEERLFRIHGDKSSSVPSRSIPQTDPKVESAFWERGALPEGDSKDNYAAILFSEDDVKRTGEALGVGSITDVGTWEAALRGDKPLLFIHAPAPFYLGYLLEPQKLREGTLPYLCVDTLLNKCPYAGLLFRSLMVEAKSYPNIQALMVSYNSLTASDLIEGLGEIRGNPQLQFLDLSGNSLTERVDELGEVLLSLPSLIDIWIDMEASQVPQIVKAITGVSLQYLYMDIMNVGGGEDFLTGWMECLRAHPTIKDLRVRLLGASPDFIENFIRTMQSNLVLKELYIDSNRMNVDLKSSLKESFKTDGKELVFFDDLLLAPVP